MNHLSHNTSRAGQQKGSILVICMVMAAVGTLGVTAWISLMDARGHLVEANMLALERRTVRENSKALAYYAIYYSHLHDKVPYTSNSEYAIADDLVADLGQCMVMPYNTAPLTETTNANQVKNGASPSRAFSTDVEVRLFKDVAAMKGSEYEAWNFQLRSYHPNLGGELLTFYPPAVPASGNPLVSGSLHVKGRAVFWDAVAKDFKGGLRANEYVLPNRIGGTATFPTVSGTNTLPLNYPIPKATTGLSAGGGWYDGTMEVFESSTNTHNSYFDKMTGKVVLDGSVATTAGPGPATRADTANDAALEAQILSQDPSTLVTSLVPYYPLSSRVLKAVALKNNPAFTGSQFRQVFEEHLPIPNDALSTLMANHGALLEPDMEALNVKNNTVYTSAGNGNVWVFLNQAALPDLYIRAPRNVYLVGQTTTGDEAAAASLPPKTIILARKDGDAEFATAALKNANRRRIILGLTMEGTSPQTTPANFQFAGSVPFPKWSMLLETRGIPANFNLSSVSGATIRGGIRTDSELNITGGTLTLEQETDYTNLDTNTTRHAWVEAYKK